jgi:transposase
MCGARIIVLTADGEGAVAITRAVGKGKTVVWRWQERFMQEGVEGLTRDKTRPSRIPPLPAATVDRVVALTNQAPPQEATHWTAVAMAKTVEISPSSVRRIWKRHGLQPHRVRSFKLFNDPKFAEKLKEVVGLYIDPPAHAVVLSIDEKSQIQALDRTQPGLPMKKGRCATMTHDYKRHGTTTLFAALDTLEGRSSGAACSVTGIRNSSAFSMPSSARRRPTRRSMWSSTIMPPTSTPRSKLGSLALRASPSTSPRPRVLGPTRSKAGSPD